MRFVQIVVFLRNDRLSFSLFFSRSISLSISLSLSLSPPFPPVNTLAFLPPPSLCSLPKDVLLQDVDLHHQGQVWELKVGVCLLLRGPPRSKRPERGRSFLKQVRSHLVAVPVSESTDTLSTEHFSSGDAAFAAECE